MKNSPSGCQQANSAGISLRLIASTQFRIRSLVGWEGFLVVVSVMLGLLREFWVEADAEIGVQDASERGVVNSGFAPQAVLGDDPTAVAEGDAAGGRGQGADAMLGEVALG